MIEIVCAHGFAYVIAQLLPRIALREDRFREAIRAETAVALWRHKIGIISVIGGCAAVGLLYTLAKPLLA